MMTLSAPQFTRFVPKQHIVHVVHEMAIRDTNLVVYVCSSEVVIVFAHLIYCPNDKLAVVLSSLHANADRDVTWANSEQRTVSSFVTRADVAVIASLLPMSTLGNQQVLSGGRIRRIRVFWHVIQAIYSRMKGTVDAAAQCNSERNCSGIRVNRS